MNRAFWKNFGVLAVGNVLTPLCSIALVLAIGRLSGPEALGAYSLIMAVFVVGQSCASFGFPIVLTREIAADRTVAAPYYAGASAVALIVVAPVVVLAVTAVSFVADAQLRGGLQLVLIALLPSVLTQFAEAALLGIDRARDLVVIALVETLARVAVSTILVLLGYGVDALAAVLVLFRVAAACVSLAVLKRHGITGFVPLDLRVCRHFFRQLPVLGAIPIVNAVYTRLDIFLLTALRGMGDVGIYSAAMRLVDVLRILPFSYTRAIYPLIARLHREDAVQRRRAVQVATAILLVLVLGAVIPVAALADVLVTFLYGQEFAAAGDVLRILVVTLVPFSLALLLAQVLFAADLQAYDLRVNVIATLTSVALNLLFIPAFGAVGASVTSLASALLYAALQYFYVSSRVGEPGLSDVLGRLALAAGAAAAVMTFAGPSAQPWNPLVLVAASLLSFATIFLFTSRSQVGQLHVVWGYLWPSRDRGRGTE